MSEIAYTTTLGGVDWNQMKARLAEDNFDNGRTADQLRRSFESSYAAVVAYADGDIIGTARVLSDGVCNAYVVDVWTLSGYRKRGVARTMLATLEADLQGQHVYLFTEEAVAFYEKVGYKEQETTGMAKIVGQWLRNTP